MPANWRGLLVGDHIGKVFTATIAPPVTDYADAYLPDTQCGCMKGRGTARASHLSRSFLQWCKTNKRPAAALFIDLSKAFDSIIREVVLGVQNHMKDPTMLKEHLASMGVAEPALMSLWILF